MTSIAFVSSSPEQKKRLVNITTTIKAADWAEIVKRIAGCRDVVDFELFRYTKYVRTGYSLSVLVESADETDDECVVRILGQPFVDKFLPVSDKKTVAQINPEFHRIMTAGKMDVEAEFLIYETISEAKNIHKSYEACLEDYKTESQNFENAIAPEAAKTFNKLAKKNHLEGGSWLCLPKLKRGEFSDSESTERNLRRILEKLCMEFCTGRLQVPYISKISYSKLKSVVKKTIYFDYMENNIGKDLGTEESLFRSDREVRMIFRHLVDMRLGAQFRYKPEIFTACKLNTKNAGMRLSLYNEMRFERKLAIAMEQ